MTLVHTDGSNSLSPWISPTMRTRPDAEQLSTGDAPRVLLIDDRLSFRHTIASELRRHAIQVVTATGVYDAWQLAQRRPIDLIVIRGNLDSQSGWQSAAKLCGCPPWRGVLMHFDEATDEDRAWKIAAGLTGLVETGGQPQPLIDCVLRVLNVNKLDTDHTTPWPSLSLASRS